MYLTHGSRAGSVEGFGDRDGRRGARGTEDHREVRGIGDSSESLVGSDPGDIAGKQQPRTCRADAAPHDGRRPGRGQEGAGCQRRFPVITARSMDCSSEPGVIVAGAGALPRARRRCEAGKRTHGPGPRACLALLAATALLALAAPAQAQTTTVTQSGGGATWSLVGENTVAAGQQTYTYTLTRTGGSLPQNEYFGFTSDTLEAERFQDGYSDCTGTNYFCFTLSNSFSYQEFTASNVRFAGRLLRDNTSPHVLTLKVATGTPTGTTVTLGVVDKNGVPRSGGLQITVAAPTNTAPTGVPTITGTAQVDQTLTAITTGIMDANGLTSPGYTYQWIRVNGSDVNISGANSSTYTLLGADLGKTIKVQVTFTDDASNTETLTSDATATVVAAGTAPTMVLSQTSLDVPEAGSASYSVKLGTLPTAEVTVSIGGTSGTDLSLNMMSLTFTTSNWNVPQTVTVLAARDSDATHDRATLTHTATGGDYGTVSADLPVTVTDITRMRLVAVVEGVSEGESMPIRAMLPMPLDDDVSITVTVAPNGGRDDEYELSANTTLTIAAGTTESTGDVVFTSLDDFTDTGVRYFDATLTPDHPRVDARTETFAVVDDDNTFSLLQVTPPKIFENGGTATLRGAKLSLHEGVVKMEVSLEPSGRATLSGNTLTFQPGALYATETLTITAVDNTLDEADQVITISATVTEGRGIRTPAPVRLTIEDDEGMSPEVALVLTPPRVREGLASTVTAVASGPLSAEATIMVSASPAHSDTRMDDYVLSANTVLTIPSGGTRSTGTVTIATADDQFSGGSRRRWVTVSGTVTGGGGVADPVDQQLVVLEDDQLIPVAVIATPATLAEGEVSTITLRSLGQPLPADVMVTIRESSDEVELSADPVLMIAEGETESTGTVTLTAVQDTNMRNGVVIVSGVPDNAFVGVAPAYVYTVDDDATAALLTVSPVPATFYEGQTSTIIAALSQTLSNTVTVTIGVDEAHVNHSATADDYTLSGNLTLTIPAGEMRGTGPTLTASNDEYFGPPQRRVVLDIASVTGIDPTRVVKHSDWYILEDEEQPRVTLETTPASIPENGGQSTVTARLNTKVASDVKVMISAAPVGTTEFDDFTQNGTQLTIPAGQKASTGTVTISTVDDDVDGPDKNLVVAGTATVVEMEMSGLVWDPYEEGLTILDDDTRGVTVSAETLPVNEGSTGTYTVVLNSQPTASVTVTPSSDNSDVAVSSALTFTTTNWNTAQAVTVTAAQDSDAVDDAATISHAVMGGDYGAVTAASVAVTVDDDEVPDTTAPTVTSIVRQTPASSPTNANSLTWRVTFSEAVSNVDATDFAVSGTTATLTVAAVSGVTGAYDVTASGGNLADLSATVTLSFAAGQNIQDAANNTLTNTAPTGTNDHTYVLDNTAPTVTITGVPGTSSAPFTATFTFSEAVTGFVVGDITLDNATASNFTVTSTTVYTALITPTANGTVTVDVAVNVAQDAVGNDNTAATQASSTYTAPVITIEAGTSPVTEGTSAAFALSRAGSTTAELTVNATVSETGGDMVAPANEGARTVTFQANSATATLSVPTVADHVDEADGVVTATVTADTATPATYTVGTPSTATVTVSDDDTRGVTVSAETLPVNEGSTGTYMVVLNSQPTASVTVTPSSDNSDVAVSSTLTFTTTNWNMAQPVTVTAAQDSDAVDGAATISHAVAGGDYGAVTAASVAVTVDDDEVPDTTAPRVTSIVRQIPASSPTNANSLTWRVTFSEAVSNVDATDFAVSGTTATLTVAAVSGVTGAYDVTASGGNLAGLSATVTLSFATGQNIQDAANIALTNTAPTGTNDHTYVLDNTAPTVTITGVPGTSSAPFTATFTFSEAVTGFVVGDITLGNATASNFTVTSTTVYTALITPTANGTVTVDVAVNVAQDAVGNDNTAATQASSTYSGRRGPSVPGAPASLTATAGDEEVALVWSAPADDGGSPVTGYEYRFAAGTTVPGDTPWQSAGLDLEWTVTGLTNGQQYAFEVRASNRVGEGEARGALATPVGAPGALASLTATAGDEEVALVWSAPADDGGTPVTGYEYRFAAGTTVPGDTPWQSAGLDLEWTVTGLTNGQQYAFEVRASNRVGEGEARGALATPVGAPGALASLTATAGDEEVALVWSAPADDGGTPVTGYEYRFAAGTAVPEDTPWQSAGLDLEWTISDLTNGQQYTFEVRARNRVGPGETSGTTALPLRLRAELFSTAVLATEGEALVVGVRRSGRLAFPAHAYIGVTDSALPGVTATEEGRDDGLGRHRLEFAAGAAEATVTVTVAFDGERRQDRVLSATLDSAELEVDGVRRRYELVTPTLVVPVTEGDAGLSVADARVQGKSSVLAFTVSMDRTRDVAVRVDYATEDGAARAGEDYTPVSGTLTIEAGGRERTVEVPVLPALQVTGERTLVLRLSNAVSAVIDDGVATGVIVRESELPKAWLARFGRTASDHAAQAIARRLEAGQRETQVTVAGRRVDGLSVDGLLLGVLPSGGWRPASAVEDMATRLAAPALAASGAPFGGVDADPGTPGLLAGTWGGAPGALDRESSADAGQTLRRAVLPDFGYRLPGAEEALMGTSFYVERGAQQDVGGGTWAAWGDVAATRFEGDAGGLALNGDVVTGTAGLDRQWRAVLVGLALSRSSGEGGYGTGAGTIASTLTSVHPYVQVRLGERAQVWGAAGWGRGGLEITPESGAALEADLRNSMAAAGARAVLMGAGGLEIALRSDFLWTETSSDGTAALAEAVGTASRGRLMLEGAGQIQGLGGVVRPKVEGGVRYDGGDAETGRGFEVGGGLDWARGSLTLQVNGRMLVAHADESYEEWGYSGSLVYEPGADGLGLQMRVGSSAGAAASGIRNLWALENASGLVRGGAVPFAQRFDAEVGYGIGRGTLWYPYFVADDSGQTRYGLKLSSGRTIGVGLEFGRRKSVDLGPEDAMLLRGELRF